MTKKKEDPTATVEEEAPASVFTVYKKQPDNVTFICGVKVEIDPDGREFFNLPESARETVENHPNLTWPE